MSSADGRKAGLGDHSNDHGGELSGQNRALVRRRSGKGKFGVSPLTMTIVIVNMISVLVLYFGVTNLNHYRDGLIASKLEGMRAQAQIIADILAQVGPDEDTCLVGETDSVLINDDTLVMASSSRFEIADLPPLPVNTPEGVAGFHLATPSCQLVLVPGEVRYLFNRIWDSFEGRVRIFNPPDLSQSPLIIDAGDLMLEDMMLREDRILGEPLPDIDRLEGRAWIDRLSAASVRIFSYLPNSYRAQAAVRTIEDELNLALAASPFAEEPGAATVRINENGELVASVSVPVRRVQAIYGIVTAEIGGIDDLVREARSAILPVLGYAFAAAILSSILLTAFIVRPIRQLAVAADSVREGISAAGRTRIPDFPNRRDEIGELSKSLKTMTHTIYARMEAIESFAADVSHELKNPLTSIRSATETLDIAKAPEAREKLMAVIKQDIVRMDRLITDISNASRLDAELAREAREAVEMPRLIADIVALYAAPRDEDEVMVSFTMVGEEQGYVLGNPSALGQVVRNLIDNARSFSPPGGDVRITMEYDSSDVLYTIRVEDNGPGIPADKLESIFTRFYTQRPKGAAFGNNSGLGLAISRQIINAHGGRIWAENRSAPDDSDAIAGARFIVELPVV